MTELVSILYRMETSWSVRDGCQQIGKGYVWLRSGYERLMPKPLEETVRQCSQFRPRPLASQLMARHDDAVQQVPSIAIREGSC